jgi:hypothetical protein
MALASVPKTGCSHFSAEIPEVECKAWQAIYDSTGGENWKDCSDLRHDPCQCRRVACEDHPAQWISRLYGVSSTVRADVGAN